ncbi:MAG: YicC/YloC family endoribonuclease [Acidobacteriota bacterium]
MQSMTGFGHTEATVGSLTFAVDVKSVNGRFLDINVRLPRELAAVEPEIRAEIQGRLGRGRVDVIVSTSYAAGQQDVNEPALEAYLAVAAKLNARGIPGELNIGTLLQLPGITSAPLLDYTSPEITSSIRSAVARALEQVVASRRAEGASLLRDLENRIAALRKAVERIASRAAGTRDYYFEKLKQRLDEAIGEQAVDQSRLAQEVIYYVERSDAAEEITRLLSHLDRFGQYLAKSESEHVGKQLDFLCQEMNREMNTILSKSPFADVAQIGVEGKAEIEKIREQVQNVE